MFKVSINNGNNSSYDCDRGEFEAGEIVRFKLYISTDTSYSISSDEVDILREVENGIMYCSFIMPARNVEITVSNKSTMACQFPPQAFAMNPKNASAISQNDSMYCYDCGAFLPAKAKFCGSCGKRCRD